MIKIIDWKLTVEKNDTHQKFYPRVIAANTVDAYPFSVPTANIKVVLNKTTELGYSVSTVKFDDLVRLQVSSRYSPFEKIQWVDIFSGRIQNLSRDFGNSNNITLECAGHEIESTYGILEVDKTYTSQDAREIIKDLTVGKMGRMVWDATYNYTKAGIIVPDYKVKPYQLYVSDVFEDMEKISGMKWFVRAEPVYDAAGNFTTSYIRWWPLDADDETHSKATKEFQIIEGTQRLLSANFEVCGDDVRTHFIIFGDTPPGTVSGSNVINAAQFQGKFADSAGVTKYGNRYQTETYGWAKSNQTCYDIAKGLATDAAHEYIAGQVKIIGTPLARVGKLAYCKIPNLESNGKLINGYFTIYRVEHNFSEQEGFTTLLDLNHIRKNEYDYIERKITKPVKILKKTAIKT